MKEKTLLETGAAQLLKKYVAPSQENSLFVCQEDRQTFARQKLLKFVHQLREVYNSQLPPEVKTSLFKESEKEVYDLICEGRLPNLWNYSNPSNGFSLVYAHLADYVETLESICWRIICQNPFFIKS